MSRSNKSTLKGSENSHVPAWNEDSNSVRVLPNLCCDLSPFLPQIPVSGLSGTEGDQGPTCLIQSDDRDRRFTAYLKALTSAQVRNTHTITVHRDGPSHIQLDVLDHLARTCSANGCHTPDVCHNSMPASSGSTSRHWGALSALAF